MFFRKNRTKIVVLTEYKTNFLHIFIQNVQEILFVSSMLAVHAE